MVGSNISVTIMYVLTLSTWCWLTAAVLTSKKGELTEKEVVEQFNQIINDERFVVALFTEPCCQCTECVEVEALLGSASQHLEESLNIKVVKLVNQKGLQKEYGVKSLPTLVYFRDRYPLTYDGHFELEDVLDWLENFKQSYVRRLNDEDFEHLTQAASGATTGDWLVFFYDSSCKEEKRDFNAKVEAIAALLKDRVNVALVNMEESPELAERFKPKECPAIIYFRHGKMYRYRFTEVTVQYLEKFANGWYKNSKAEAVPSPKTPFDRLTDLAITVIQEHPEVIIITGAGLVVVLILLTFCISFLSSKEKVD